MEMAVNAAYIKGSSAVLLASCLMNECGSVLLSFSELHRGCYFRMCCSSGCPSFMVGKKLEARIKRLQGENERNGYHEAENMIQITE